MTRATTRRPTPNGPAHRGGGSRRSRPAVRPAAVRAAPAAAAGTGSNRDDVDDLSGRLAELERELQQVWASLLVRDAGMAGRVGHAGRLVHRAVSILETDTIY